MNDLDSRLRDALEAAAGTVPDNAVPPGLANPVRRGRRPQAWGVAALAAAAVVLAVAVPYVLPNDDEKGGVAGTSCPTPQPVQEPVPTIPQEPATDPNYSWLKTLPFGSPPKVPYTLNNDHKTGGGFLQDGSIRVPLPADRTFASWGQVECGWVGAMFRLSAQQQEVTVGRLWTSGQFDSFGNVSGDGIALSPGNERVAFVTPMSGGKARLTVVEVATGREVASTPTDPVSDVLGWNDHGIFFAPQREEKRTRLWKPGSEPVPIDTGGAHLTAWRTTDRMLLSPTRGASTGPACPQVVTLEAGNKLTKVMERCGEGIAEGSMSPDGRVLVVPDKNQTERGYLIPENTPTKLQAQRPFSSQHETIWEDDRHMLSQMGINTDRAVTLRCNVVDGRCEKIADGSQELAFNLGYR